MKRRFVRVHSEMRLLRKNVATDPDNRTPGGSRGSERFRGQVSPVPDSPE